MSSCTAHCLRRRHTGNDETLETLPRRFPQRRDHKLGGHHRREFYAPCQRIRIDYEDVLSGAEWGRWAVGLTVRQRSA